MMKKLVIIFLIAAAAFAAQTFSPTLESFTAGQVSSRLEGRADFAAYRSSCRLLENMFVKVQGPATRRPGTRYIADTNDSSSIARLIPFEYSTDDSYVLLIENGTIGFFRTTE